MVYCISFREAVPSNISEIGPKAYNLADLYKAGFPIPAGFIIKSRAFTDFIVKNRLSDIINSSLDSASTESYASLRDASAKIAEAILKSSMPEDMAKEITDKYKNISVSEDMKGLNAAARSIIDAGRDAASVAVRCSPVSGTSKRKASGIHRSALNITGTPALLKSVIQSFASFYSPEAIWYYKKNNIRSPELAIVVQEMVQSEKSGVLSTANPVTNNMSEFVIESSYGLGSSLTEGEVIPDRYILNVRESTITEAKIGRKSSQLIVDKLNGGTKKERTPAEDTSSSSLTTAEIKVIAEISDKIQVRFNHPQDIEWAISKRRVYILESTPMNTIIQQQQPTITQETADDDSSRPLIAGTPVTSLAAKGRTRVINSPHELSNIENDTIIVTGRASVDMLPSFSKAKGIIASSGGILSSLAKIAREMQIPLIVGAPEAQIKLSSTELISLDTKGRIFESSSPGQNQNPYQNQTPMSGQGSQLQDTDMPPIAERMSDDELIIATKIRLNAHVNRDYSGLKDISDGVGYIKLNGSKAQQQYQTPETDYRTPQAPPQYSQPLQEPEPENPELTYIHRLADTFYPKSVWVRTKEPASPEFRSDLKALKMMMDKGYSNIGFMFPAGHHSSYVERIKDVLTESGLNPESIEFGLSLETPAACMLADEYSKTGIKFVSLDLDRIIRNTLGLAPETKLTNHALHPAVLKMLRHSIKSYRKNNIITSAHGQSISSQDFIEKLIEYHIDSITVESENIRMYKYVAARKERKLLLEIMVHKHHLKNSQ